MVLTNLVPVPNMTSGWSVNGTTEVIGYGGGSSIKLTGTTSIGEVTVNTSAKIALTPSHIYYARVYGYQTEKAGGSVGFYWPIAEPNFQEGLPLKDAGSWQLYSGRTDRTSFSSGSYQFRLDYNNNNVAGTMYFSSPMLIDLTEAFGSGNEPTKEWMDSNIPYFVERYVKLRTGDIINCAYTGAVQPITLPKGVYKLEVWGAQGGYRSNSTYGGKGGYSVGTITLTEKTNVYIYVGGSGNTGGTSGGFNGGGKKYSYYGGGGASDIRINQDSLYARVIVAGGGGSDGAQNKTGMYGGGTTGGSTSANYGSGGYGGTQTGVSSSSWQTTAQSTSTTSKSGAYAGFGFGGNGIYRSNGYGGAGGGGWYGGSGSYPDDSGDDDRGGGGGSGFVWIGSNAPSGYLLGSEYYLSNASTIAGNASMPSTSGGTETGHTGNGYARITVISINSFNGYVKADSGWKEISDLFVKVSIDGTPVWKNANSIQIRDTSAWKNS